MIPCSSDAAASAGSAGAMAARSRCRTSISSLNSRQPAHALQVRADLPPAQQAPSSADSERRTESHVMSRPSAISWSAVRAS